MFQGFQDFLAGVGFLVRKGELKALLDLIAVALAFVKTPNITITAGKPIDKE